MDAAVKTFSNFSLSTPSILFRPLAEGGGAMATRRPQQPGLMGASLQSSGDWVASSYQSNAPLT